MSAVEYELAPVHADFAPPSRGIWDWHAIMVKGTGDIVCMVPNRERGEQIMLALASHEGIMLAARAYVRSTHLMCAYPGCREVAEIIAEGEPIPAGSAGRKHLYCPAHEPRELRSSAHDWRKW